MGDYWSYILAPFRLFGMWAAGRRFHWGWLFSLGTQTLWLAYAVQTRQYGFIPGSLAFVYVDNYVIGRTGASVRVHVQRLTGRTWK